MKLNTIAVAYLVIIILLAHLGAPEIYSWTENTISDLGAQGYGNAWIMHLGFICFGALVVYGAVQRARGERSLWYREAALAVYGGAFLLSGLFSTAPFVQGVAYSEAEARLHSGFATAAGLAIVLGILLYMLTDKPVKWKVVDLAALLLITTLSALFGMASSNAGLIQRSFWLVGFAWLVWLEWRRKS